MSLTVLETAVVADSVADFSVSFKTFALVEMVAAMDAGDNGAGGKASAMVSGAVVAAATDSVADESGANADSTVDSGATCESSIDEGASNDLEPSSGSSYDTWTWSCLGVISRPFSFMSFMSHLMMFLAMRFSLYSRGG